MFTGPLLIVIAVGRYIYFRSLRPAFLLHGVGVEGAQGARGQGRAERSTVLSGMATSLKINDKKKPLHYKNCYTFLCCLRNVWAARGWETHLHSSPPPFRFFRPCGQPKRQKAHVFENRFSTGNTATNEKQVFGHITPQQMRTHFVLATLLTNILLGFCSSELLRRSAPHVGERRADEPEPRRSPAWQLKQKKTNTSHKQTHT